MKEAWVSSEEIVVRRDRRERATVGQRENHRETLFQKDKKRKRRAIREAHGE